MGCGPSKGKERKNATVAQELLSEETLQQLLKQEELWQTQNRKRNKENCILDSSGGGCCFLDTFSFKQHDDSKCPPSSLISAGSGLGPCCSSSCTPPGCLPVCRANCGITNGLWDAKICLSCSQPENLWGCITYFRCWRTKSKTSWSQQWKNQLLQFSRLFKGIKLQPLGVSIM